MPVCDLCGADDWRVTPLVGMVKLFKCQKCGVEQVVHVNDTHSPESTENEAVLLSLSIRLPDSVTVEQIVSVRQIMQELGEEMSLVAIKKSITAGDLIELGEYPEPRVKAVVQQIAGLGLAEAVVQKRIDLLE